MDLYSNYADIYLNGKLQQYVVAASDERGEVLLIEQDYCRLRLDPSGTHFVPSDGRDSVYGYATILCRGEVKIVPKEKIDSSHYVWLEPDYDQTPRFSLLPGIVRFNQVEWCELYSSFTTCDLPGIVTPEEVFYLSDVLRDSTTITVRLTAHSDLRSCLMVIRNSTVSPHNNQFSDPTLTGLENNETGKVDLTIQTDELADLLLVDAVMAWILLLKVALR